MIQKSADVTQMEKPPALMFACSIVTVWEEAVHRSRLSGNFVWNVWAIIEPLSRPVKHLIAYASPTGWEQIQIGREKGAETWPESFSTSLVKRGNQP
jgi:hypothetical protein